ncbi:hypothetical protein M501DRAFT_932661, partial [Patellaria atrata CBS 101060]
TASPQIRASLTALDVGAHIWCRPYLTLSPHCFVLDDGDGRPVGYVIGVQHTSEYVRNVKGNYLPSLKIASVGSPVNSPPHEAEKDYKDPGLIIELHKVLQTPELMLHEKHPRILETWPAHLHIDILPSHQRQGWGRKMIEHFCNAVEKGVHVVVNGKNEGAFKFYEKVGFERYREGEGQDGVRSDGTVCFVRDG